MDNQTDVRTLRTALFLDFDNVYSGLRTMSSEAAESFGRDPSRWLRWLAEGSDDDGAFRRRFLVRACYLNPSRFSRFRSFFTSSGFKVVDCPSLTQAGKSSADIHLVLDAVDSLSHSTRYDEYVICSADADFTPLMTRIRAQDRITTMVAAGPASTAYSSVCDHVVDPLQLAEHLLSTPSGSTPTRPQRDNHVVATHSNGAPTRGQPDVPLDDVLAAVRAAVACADQPLPGGAAAHAAVRVDPAIAGSGWAGSGNFAAFVREQLPELRFVRDVGGSWLFDPGRHTPSDVPVQLPEGIAAQVCRVTNVPRLNTGQSAVIFEELVSELVEANYHFVATPKVVRESAAERGVAVSRGAVSSIIQGILNGGLVIGQAQQAPRTLAVAWRDHVKQRCQAARMELSEEELLEIDEWILGGLKS